MEFAQLLSLLTDRFGPETFPAHDAEVAQPWIEVQPAKLPEVCLFLRDHDTLWFDFLACLTGVDLGPKDGRLEVVYHLNSLTKGLAVVLRCRTQRVGQDQEAIPSVAHIWRTAEWHEREAFDLVGIPFSGHPDLRRILMPEDWEGHPLRKDYQQPEFYHGVKTEY